MTAFEATLKRSNPNELSARLAGKLAAFIVILMLAVALLVTGVGRAFAASSLGTAPRQAVMVKGENVRLGDVFDGVSQNADFVLAPAPAPGEELVWNTPTLLRIATAFNLPWRPDQGAEVRIRRAAALVDSATIKAVLRDHLASLEENNLYTVNFTSSVPEIIVPGSGTPDIRVTDFNMLPTGGTFSAVVRISTGEGRAETLNMRGVAERMVRLPVLKTTIRNGQIITPENITWVTQRSTGLRGDLVRDSDALVGSTPRRTINAGEVIRADALEMPRLIKSGDIVTMIYKHNSMMLTARGRALQDGTKGDVIKVSNTGSNRTIEARVTGNREVTVY